MAKRFRVASSLILGVAGGAAAAVFLASETGKKMKKKVRDFVADYQEHPEEVHAELAQKAQDFGEQVRGRYDDVKEQLETGELTVDDLLESGKEKALLLREQSLERIAKIKEKLAAQEVTTSDLLQAITEKGTEAVAESVTKQEVITIELPEIDAE